MSVVIEALQLPDGWSSAYIKQLATYVRERDRDGYCYGNRELFEKRHKAILEWIEHYEEYVSHKDVKFKRKTK